MQAGADVARRSRIPAPRQGVAAPPAPRAESAFAPASGVDRSRSAPAGRAEGTGAIADDARSTLARLALHWLKCRPKKIGPLPRVPMRVVRNRQGDAGTIRSGRPRELR